MSKLVKIAGIAIAASRVKAKATHVTLLCKNCRSVKTVPCRPGLGGAIVPRSCDHVPQVYFLSNPLNCCKFPLLSILDLNSLKTV
jgi:DNA replicative helicase MCM subunit Mcm2 (Cdc46/Mcm family)